MNNQWKIVPVEPTDEMRSEIPVGLSVPYIVRVYQSMLAAAPVPPAGDVEVLACLTSGGRALYFPSENIEWREGDIELVDRAHVTRLTAECDGLLVDVGQANALIESHAQVIRDQEQLIQRQRVENEALTIQTNDLHGVVQRLNAARRRIRPDGSGSVVDQSAVVAVAELQSELTKARELLADVKEFLAYPDANLMDEVNAFLTTHIARNVDESCEQDAKAANICQRVGCSHEICGHDAEAAKGGA